MAYDIFNQIDDKAYVVDIFKNPIEFNVPAYQRGYRWGETEVNKLLADLDEVITNNKDYCLNPISLSQPNGVGKIDVIDGQQRLTTLYILYDYLKVINIKAKIYYEARNSSVDIKSILPNIKNRSIGNNVDEYFFNESYKAIEKYFNASSQKKNEFIKYLNEQKLNYLIYKVDKNDDYGVFIRMNKEKIPLTDAEKVKSLFVSYDEYKNNDLKLNIAYSWDNIENELQNDEFWYYIYNDKQKKIIDTDDINDSRIQFILEIVLEQSGVSSGLVDFYYKKYKEYINNNQQNKELDSLWIKIEHCFGVLKDWYNDIEIYHYMGFMLYREENIAKKIKDYYKFYESNTKDSFIKQLKKDTKKKICKSLNNVKCINENDNEIDFRILESYKFDENKNCPKRDLYDLLLFFNVAYYINKSINVSKKEEYNDLKLFEHFSFYHFKKDNWQIEHISPVNDKDVYANKDSQLKIIVELLYYLQLNKNSGDKTYEAIKDKLLKFYNKYKDDKDTKESEIKNEFVKLKIEDIINDNLKNRIDDDCKNTIKNFCLLDAATNEGYGDSLYFEKRRWILGKTLGYKLELVVNEKGYVEEREIEQDGNNPFSSYILPCTEKVFTKSFSNGLTDLYSWTNDDGDNYINAIKKIFEKTLNDGG